MCYANVLLCLLLFHLQVSYGNETDIYKNSFLTNLTNDVLAIFGINLDESNDVRIKDLRYKIEKINNYAIDKQKLDNLITNVTKDTILNTTSFYKSLIEKDNFYFLSNKEPKNLYLQLKERMNRDDILGILANNGQKTDIVKSARKVMGQDFDEDDDDEMLNIIVDKILGETPSDNHKYDYHKIQSIYWDPQSELEDRKEFHQRNGRRIFRGERTTIRYYPFIVSIHVMGRFWCGGSLYWHDLVITSAACLQLMHNNRFFRENPKVLQVRIGSNHSRISGEVVDALEVYFHPGYNPRTLRHNIAVVRLNRHIKFNYHRIPKIISISHSSTTVPATAEILVLGWGVTKISQKMSYEPVFLQRKLLPVYPNSFCKEVYGSKFITETMFCAGTFTTGEGACDHDAGGPAILGGSLVGVISFGPTMCGYPNAPTVFTLVGAYADWIKTINETMPGYYQSKSRTTSTTKSTLLEYLGTMKSVMNKRPALAEINKREKIISVKALMHISMQPDELFIRFHLAAVGVHNETEE
ncbi:hypothetical protein ACJJTC_000776 [Scirpophaga incertulas]